MIPKQTFLKLVDTRARETCAPGQHGEGLETASAGSAQNGTSSWTRTNFEGEETISVHHSFTDTVEQGGRWDGPPVAVFWDQSLVWGLLLVEALEVMNVPYHLVTASQIHGHILANYRILVVPGGWAAHKARALGAHGLENIKEFVANGGNYIGFCGGAGLALAGGSSLNLVPIQRKTLSQRLPNASGEVWIEGNPEHPLWQGLPPRIPVSVWWPSQFAWDNGMGVEAVARYCGFGEDFWVADLCAADVAACGGSWKEWETGYGINLDPTLLCGQAAILGCQVGKGFAVLSYPHLECPSGWGRRLFRHILGLLQDGYPALPGREVSPDTERKSESGNCPHRGTSVWAHGLGLAKGVPQAAIEVGPCVSFPDHSTGDPPSVQAFRVLQEAYEDAGALITFGQRHLLWRWRRPWVLHWQRGVRGLEYGSLFVGLRFMVSHWAKDRLASGPTKPWDDLATGVREKTRTFCQLARKLLLEEKAASHRGPIGKLQSVNPSVDALREILFGRGMSHAGLSQQVFDALDALLYLTLQRRRQTGQFPKTFWTEEAYP